MMSWRERLCGTVALQSLSDAQPTPTMDQIVNPSDVMSDGGSYNKSNTNAANMSTIQKNVILPTSFYSVMTFNKEGTAVIYSDSAKPASKSQTEFYPAAPAQKFLN